MAAQPVPITGSVLSWAREQAGFSVDGLAERLAVPATEVALWESEEAAPSKGQVTKLAEALKRPTAVFFLPSVPLGASVSPRLRSAPGLGGKPLQAGDLRVIRRAQRRQAMLSWCIRDRGDPPIDLPKHEIDTDALVAGEDARQRSGIAVDEQLEWDSDSVAFRSWRAVLERLGIFVEQSSLGRGGIRGFSTWDEHAPLVVVNSSYVPAARSFTMMHEYGHLLNRGDAACQDFVGSLDDDRAAERWCERFAAAYLVPTEALHRVAGRDGVTRSAPAARPKEVRRMANRFRVSGRAMAIRLTDSGLGTRDLYNVYSNWSKLRDWNPQRKSSGGGEPRLQKRRRELGIRTLRTMLEAMDSGQLNLRDATDYLGLSPNEIDDLSVQIASE